MLGASICILLEATAIQLVVFSRNIDYEMYRIPGVEAASKNVKLGLGIRNCSPSLTRRSLISRNFLSESGRGSPSKKDGCLGDSIYKDGSLSDERAWPGKIRLAQMRLRRPRRLKIMLPGEFVNCYCHFRLVWLVQ